MFHKHSYLLSRVMNSSSFLNSSNSLPSLNAPEYWHQSVRVHLYFFAFTVEAPVLSVQSTTATTISLSWTSAGLMVDNYEVMWQRDTSGDCPDQDVGSNTLNDGSTSYIITGLEESSNYTITVIATNANEIATSNYVTGFTQESGLIMSLLEFSKIGRHASDLLYTFLSAPSTSPTSVSVSEVTPSTITVQWGAVDCIHRNGDITGYTVQYGVQGNGSIQTVSVPGGGSTQTIISRLTSSTTYFIEVAAVNSAGTGVYSNAMMQLTQGIISYTILNNLHFIHSLQSFSLVKPPVLSVIESTAVTAISLFWTSAGSVVDSYEVLWQRDNSGDCPDENHGSMSITDGSTSYMITGLEEDSSYSITVEAVNSIGMVTSNTATAMTQETGKQQIFVNTQPGCMKQCHIPIFLQCLLPHLLMWECRVAHSPASLSTGKQWTASTAMET